MGNWTPWAPRTGEGGGGWSAVGGPVPVDMVDMVKDREVTGQEVVLGCFWECR